MRVIFSPDHVLRDAKTELCSGELRPPFENPERAERIRAAVLAAGHGPETAPADYGLAPVRAVHHGDYLAFLETCWRDWRAAGHAGEAMATVWPSRRMTRATPPRDIEGRLGYYALAAETAITEGTYAAARAAANVAVAAADSVADGAGAAFALGRPPGHHAAQDMFGGYCFLNNAAIAAERLRAKGAARVAVLDVDFHHGNGTQSIFYDRPDVFFASLHGDPEEAFPHFLGGADETGVGAGEGATANYPMPPGTEAGPWFEALEAASARLTAFGAEALVVSLGLDAHKADPISFFRLDTPDFARMGARLAALGAPTVFVLEGGYAMDEIAGAAAAALSGFEGG